MTAAQAIVIPAERSESRDPCNAIPANTVRMLVFHGSRIAAGGGFRDDNRVAG
jgi:hypothetical protein